MALMKISDIKANPNNPRIIKDDKFKKLVESVKSFPEMLELRPIVVNKDMIILWGNMRYKACKEAGLKEIPVIIADNLTEEQEREFLIKDNVSGWEWDWDLLANEWDKEELEEWGLDVTFETVEPEAEEDEFEVDEGIKTDIVLGDLFEIWPHRLLCWDSTNIDDVNKLMNGEKADMVFTDPPYWISHSWKGIKWNAKENDFWEILWDWDVSVAIDSFNLCSWLFPEATLIFWWANYYSSCLPNWFGWIVWDKQREWDTFSGAELAFVNKGVKVDIFRHQWHWMIKASEHWEKRVHPTQKPIELVRWSFDNYNAWDNVLDLFWWSGSTMVACHQLNRKCYMSELDPKYVQTIINRMIKLDSTIEIKRNWVPYAITEISDK